MGMPYHVQQFMFGQQSGWSNALCSNAARCHSGANNTDEEMS
jgi:hypothetical protein